MSLGKKVEKKEKSMKYLDPKFELTFKKVFAENADLAISLLNALLPLEEGREVESLSYIPTEIIPDDQHERLSIVDVRCKDNHGRQFIVEMQMQWQKDFVKRVAVNLAKAYSSQSHEGDLTYAQNEDVYSLNLVNAKFKVGTDKFLHHYNLINESDLNDRLNLFHFTFVELPKFKPETMKEKRKAVLWLRFLTENDEGTYDAPAELKADTDIQKALDIIEKRSYSPAQLRAYDRYTDEKIRYLMLMGDKFEEGWRKGEQDGHERGVSEGREEGKRKALFCTVQNMLSMGLPLETIAKATGVSKTEIDMILNTEPL